MSQIPPTQQTASNRPAVHPEDLFRLEFLQDAQLSPDGRTVAYVTMTVDKESDAEQCAIYLFCMETGAVRRLTNGLTQDTTPRWSPDGQWLSFGSTRSGKRQLYRIAIDGGEALQLTTLPQGIGGDIAWSPDGTQIAFTAPPQAPPPDPTEPYRITRSVYRFDKVGYLEQRISDLYVIDVNGGEPHALTSDAFSNDAPRWSPDGKRLLYLTTMFPHSHRVGAALRTVDLAGNIEDIVWSWGTVTAATWTNDSRQIVFIGTPEGRPIGTQDKLWIVDCQSAEETASTGSQPTLDAPRCLTPTFNFKIGGGLQMDMPLRFLRTPRIFISKDNAVAYVQAQVGGTVAIYRVALEGTEAWDLVCEEGNAHDSATVFSCFPMDLRGDHLIYFRSDHFDPVQLYDIDVVTGVSQRLTSFNDDLLAQWDQPTVEQLTFMGSDGTPVEGWIMLPAGAQSEDPASGGPYPTILYIHGGPHSAFGHIFSFDFRLLASAGFAVLFINQRASTGYGDTFATQIKGDWGNLDYHDLMAGVDAAIAKGWVNGERMGVCGLSGGGNLSCWIVGQTDRFNAAVPENPVTNWVSFYGVSDIGPWFAVEQLGGHPHEIPEVYARCSPITYAHRCKTPTLLIQGEHDWRCPAEQSEQFYSVLKANGCTVEMLRLPASAHAGSIDGPPPIRRAHNEALLTWMKRYV